MGRRYRSRFRSIAYGLFSASLVACLISAPLCAARCATTLCIPASPEMIPPTPITAAPRPHSLLARALPAPQANSCSPHHARKTSPVQSSLSPHLASFSFLIRLTTPSAKLTSPCQTALRAPWNDIRSPIAQRRAGCRWHLALQSRFALLSARVSTLPS
jgi:hypothetical protein